MKKLTIFLCSIMISLAGLFFVQLNFSNKARLQTAEAYTATDVNAGFEDNEHLNALLNSSIDLGTSFNVLEHVNLETYDQNPYGTCYAMSLAQTLNLSYEYQYQEHIKVSAMALALQMRDLTFNEGASQLHFMEATYNYSYVSEFDFPYEKVIEYDGDISGNSNKIDNNFEAYEFIDVDEYYMFPYGAAYFSTTKATCLEMIKKGIKTEGALAMGISYQVAKYGDNYIFDTSFSSPGSHAMVLVGYDDNFSASNFVTTPSTDGAFMILNSWGTEQQIIYISYDDIDQLMYIYGVGNFIEPDERNEEISNISTAKYGMFSSFSFDRISSTYEVGYQLSNTTSNSYLKQIDLQQITSHSLANYFASTDIKLFVNPASDNLNGTFEEIGTFDIAPGCNKIILDDPINVSGDFAVKIQILDEGIDYAYADRNSQNFETLYNVGGVWKAVAHADNNSYNLIKTPFYVRTIFGDLEDFEISKTDNHQISNALETITYSVSSSNHAVTAVGVQVLKYDKFNASIDKVNFTTTDVSSLFSITATNNSFSITPKSDLSGTFKLIVLVNGGEKTFTKYITLDDKIGLTTFKIDPSALTADYEDIYYTYRLYSSSMMANEINVTIPSYFDLEYKNRYGNELDIAKSFLYNKTDAIATASYVVNSSSKILKATITFNNTIYNTTKVVTINFIYEDGNKIFYVTGLSTATHSNPEYVGKGVRHEFLDATAPNYRFLGWYSDASFLSKVSAITPPNDGLVYYVYAKFQPITNNDFVKSVYFDSSTNILTAELDFSSFDLSAYDVMNFSNITHTLNTTYSAVSYNALVSNTYDYNVYIPTANLAASNKISFSLTFKRLALQGYSNWDVLTFTQNISFSDVVVVNVSVVGKGKVTKSSNQNIEYSGDVYMNYNSNLSLTFIPDEDNYISKVVVDGKAITVNDYYNFNSLKQNHTIQVEFASNSFNVSTTLTGDGNIGERKLVEKVTPGSSLTYVITANAGSYIESITVGGSSLEDVYQKTTVTYTIDNINKDYQIEIVFRKYVYQITATVSGAGSIGQELVVSAEHGQNIRYSLVPAEGYILIGVMVDGEPYSEFTENGGEYEFVNVQKSHTIDVTFKRDQYIITFEVNGSGHIEVSNTSTHEHLLTITSSRTYAVDYETSLTYLFFSDEGFELSILRVDGSLISGVYEYGHTSIKADHSVSATFTLKTYTLSVSYDGKGFVNQPAILVKNHGDAIVYNFTPSNGYKVANVSVNGTFIGAVNSYSIANITSDYVIRVVFEIQVFTITFKTYDDKLIIQKHIEYGIYPDIDFTVPTREGADHYYYEFAGWNTSIDGTGTSLSTVTGDCTYYAQYAKVIQRFEIKVSCGANGSISPSDILVPYGFDQMFSIIAKDGYHVSKVFVDGQIVDTVEVYTFKNVQEDHTISAQFRKNDFKATITSDDEKGEIVGGLWYERGEKASFKINVKEGFKVKSVYVNGVQTKISDDKIVVENVTKDLSIVVEYEEEKTSGLVDNLKQHIVLTVVVIALIFTGVGVVFVVKKSKKNKYKY